MRSKTGAFSSQVASLGDSENAIKDRSIFKPSGVTWRLGKCDQRPEHFQAERLHLATRKMRSKTGAFSSRVASLGDSENAIKQNGAAVMRAPLAALQHIKADGEEFLEQKQQTFYLMAFNALLKPTLLLCGLVMASVMFVVMANFLNVTMGLAFISSQGDSIIGIVGIFVMFVISFFIHYQLCMRSFGLITKVPEAVADLLGVRDGSRGEHGDSDTIVAGVVGFTKQSMHRAATVAAIREEKKDGKDKPNPNGAGGGGDAPAANTGALSPAAAKGGAAPAGGEGKTGR
jgi:hypothetical protein